MDLRAFLKSYIGLWYDEDPDFDRRFWQGTALKGVEVPAIRPLIVYRFGNLHNGLPGDDTMAGITQPVVVYFHDEPGDFGDRIDPIVNSLAYKMGQPFPDSIKTEYPGVIKTQLDYVSEDHWDHEWGTAMRYVRFWIHARNPEFQET